MPLVKSEYACPLCQRQTGALNQIVANAGRLECSANPQHVWLDTMEFQNLNPQMAFKAETPAPAPQQNHTPYQVSLPIPVKDALESKFGPERLRATLASILTQLTEGDTLIIGQVDLERLENGERGLGRRPETSGELVGMIFALRQEVEDAKIASRTAEQEVKAYEGISAGAVVINLGDQYQKAADRARAQDPPLPTKIWLERQVHNALESDWF
jgi:hypothetical protein